MGKRTTDKELQDLLEMTHEMAEMPEEPKMNDETLQNTYALGAMNDRVKELGFHVDMIQKQIESVTRSLELILQALHNERDARMALREEVRQNLEARK